MIFNFKAVFVKLDDAGLNVVMDRQFAKLAFDLRLSKDILVAEVRFSDANLVDEEHIPDEEKILKQRLNITKLPALFLFTKNNFDDAIQYTNIDHHDSHSLREFIFENIPDISLDFPSCIPELTAIVKKFVSEKPIEQKAILNQIELMLDKYDAATRPNAQIYHKILKRLLERGELFLTTERQRIKNLLAGKTTQQKYAQFKQSYDILFCIQMQNIPNVSPKENTETTATQHKSEL